MPLLPLAALAFRRGILICGLGLLLAGLMLPPPVMAQEFSAMAWWFDVQAWRLLQASQPEAAAARFADPRWRAVAQYRAGQFEQVNVVFECVNATRICLKRLLQDRLSAVIVPALVEHVGVAIETVHVLRIHL